MKVTQHRPDFIDCLEAPWRGEAETIAQLTMLPFVQRFWAAPGFYQFSKALAPQGYLLMAEFRGGMHACVVAHLSGPDATKTLGPLPEWTKGHIHGALPNRLLPKGSGELIL